MSKTPTKKLSGLPDTKTRRVWEHSCGTTIHIDGDKHLVVNGSGVVHPTLGLAIREAKGLPLADPDNR